MLPNLTTILVLTFMLFLLPYHLSLHPDKHGPFQLKKPQKPTNEPTKPTAPTYKPTNPIAPTYCPISHQVTEET